MVDVIMAAPPVVLSPAARLPVELIEMICEELASLDSRLYQAGTTNWYHFHHREALAAAARISRQWTHPAQTTLLRSLCFVYGDDCAKFLAAMEHNPQLFSLPRGLQFSIIDYETATCPPHLGMCDFIPILFNKCRNVERVHISTELNLSSNRFNAALYNMRNLRTFVFESRRMVGHSNAWFQSSVRYLPPSVRLLGVQNDVDVRVIFDVPATVDLLEYWYFENYPNSLIRRLINLLEPDNLPVKFSRFNLYYEPFCAPQIDVSPDMVASLTALFAARGIVFKLFVGPWNPAAVLRY
ncbi:hypothetical protein JCM8208_006100 [Rhodotorula glutinis]